LRSNSELLAGFVRLPQGFDRRARRVLEQTMARLPAFEGKPIRVVLRSALFAHRGTLLSGLERGTPVHAGSFLRRRQIVLDRTLCAEPSELSRILVHEIFHFVWLRMGNHARRSFEAQLAAELQRNARGELGWSADLRKQALSPGDVRARNRRWREYVCESFCDSAAWLHTGAKDHEEFTLARRFQRARWEWLCHFEAVRRIPI
jgi:hypothetical protein